MININEIRIGNIVCLNESSPANNEFIGKPHKWELSDFQYPQYYSPIQLTQEILFNCGFIKKQKVNYGLPVIFLNEHFFISQNGNNKYLFISGLRVDCEYLHQLQNLYFVLTGKEITTTI